MIILENKGDQSIADIFSPGFEPQYAEKTFEFSERCQKSNFTEIWNLTLSEGEDHLA